MSTQGTPTPIRFRCSRCEKVLKVSRSKAGQVVTCPACSVELIVPDAPPEPTPGAVAEAAPPADAGSPLAFLNLKLDEGPPSASSPPPPPAAAPIPVLAPTLPSAGPAVAADEPAFPMIQVDPEPVRPTAAPRPAPAVASGSAPVSVNERGARRNDVVLSRSVVMLWSFTMLLAIVFAFTTGLLLGHFVWRG